MAERDSARLAGQSFKLEDHGIALPSNCPREEDINRAELQIIESSTYQEITDQMISAE